MEVNRTKDGKTVVRVSIGNERNLKSAFFILDDVRDVPLGTKELKEEEQVKNEKSQGLEELTEITQNAGGKSNSNESTTIASYTINDYQIGGGKVSQDVYMTYDLFKFVIDNAVEIPNDVDRNILKPINEKYVNFNELASNLQETALGGRKKKVRKTIRKNKKKRTSKKTRRY